MNKKLKLSLFLLRISLGWTFLWAFVDKAWGLGFTTKTADAWINGGSPTSGFLMFATKGPFADFFKSLVGNNFVDVLFMAGLLGIGAGLLLGLAMRLSVFSGVVLLALMYIAGSIPPEHNPLIDEHIVYIFSLLALYYLNADTIVGMGNWWRNLKLIKKFPFLA